MTANFALTAALASDPLFQVRVQAAMVTAAITVASEAIGTQTSNAYNLRHGLAVNILQNTMGDNSFVPSGTVAWLNQFTWAVAADTTIAGELGPLITITSSTSAIPSVVLTATAHGFTTGWWVEVSGHTGNTAINGTHQVTVIDSTHFSIPNGSGVAGSGGVVNQEPTDTDIQATVNSVFGSIAGVGSIT